jgi:hypothetical protein
MRTETINAIKAAGFRVFMRKVSDSYCHFTSADGLQVGYLEENRLGGFNIGTTHRPNRDSGTGYRIHDGISGPLTITLLSDAFIMRPAWAHGPMPAKWKSIDEFMRDNSFNAGYSEV